MHQVPHGISIDSLPFNTIEHDTVWELLLHIIVIVKLLEHLKEEIKICIYM